LRQRASDIELLAYHVLQEHAASNPVAPKSFSPGALRLLCHHDWPGNVRELCNVVQRALITCDGDKVLPCHLAFLSTWQPAHDPPSGEFRAARAAALAAFERRYIEDMLRKHHGNVTHAAREAHQDRRAFGRFVKKYQISPRAL
jgi:two-component system, NtrC family, response regulator GlrR